MEKKLAIWNEVAEKDFDGSSKECVRLYCIAVGEH